MFWIYVLLLSTFILLMAFYNTLPRETFATKTIDNTAEQTLILLGDSVLKNDDYVPPNENVQDVLRKSSPSSTGIFSFATDHAKINQVFEQIDNIPHNLNFPSTTVFLSIGGNDLLSVQNPSLDPSKELKPMKSAYKTLLNALKEKLPDAQIVLLDVYFPQSTQYKNRYQLIEDWNAFLLGLGNEPGGPTILSISKLFTSPSDFTLDIEPSSEGTLKLVQAMRQSL